MNEDGEPTFSLFSIFVIRKVRKTGEDDSDKVLGEKNKKREERNPGKRISTHWMITDEVKLETVSTNLECLNPAHFIYTLLPQKKSFFLKLSFRN